MTTTDPPAKLTRVRDHSTDPVVDWLDGKREVIDGLVVLDGHVIAETVEFTADPPHPQRYLPPVGWVPVDPNIGTPVFDAVQEGWSWRTVKGRKSRLDMSYDAFVAASRTQHSTWHGRQR
jgi:hypothetical protein